MAIPDRAGDHGRAAGRGAVHAGLGDHCGRQRLWAVAAAQPVGRHVGMMLYFGSLAFMPIAQSLAGLFTSPIFVLLMTVVVSESKRSDLGAYWLWPSGLRGHPVWSWACNKGAPGLGHADACGGRVLLRDGVAGHADTMCAEESTLSMLGRDHEHAVADRRDAPLITLSHLGPSSA